MSGRGCKSWKVSNPSTGIARGATACVVIRPLWVEMMRVADSEPVGVARSGIVVRLQVQNALQRVTCSDGHGVGLHVL